MSNTTDSPRTLLPGLEKITSRRDFLRKSALTAVAVGAAGSLAACKADETAPASASATQQAANPGVSPPGGVGHPVDHSGGTLPAGTSVSRAETMDAMHEKGIKAFPAATRGKGNQIMTPRVENGVKIFELTATELQWETEPGKMVQAWVYNEQLPGPQIRVTEGDRVRIVITNKLSESTSIHFHGVLTPNDQDGVPFITQPPVKPGQTFTYEFIAKNAGSHMYHSHHNAAKQVGLGLLGAFVIESKRKRKVEQNVALDYVMILNDGMHGYTINGKGFPATEPLVAKMGQKVRIRFMNEGMMIHPMHLHGMPMLVIDKDGYPQPMPWKCDTLNVAPGERWDVIVECDNPGTWAFHCHVLPHAESEHGMFGMVTALIVQPNSPVA